MFPPGVSSLNMPYGGGNTPGQNVYITPVQQRPDGMGGMLWSPYAAPAEGYVQPNFPQVCNALDRSNFRKRSFKKKEAFEGIYFLR